MNARLALAACLLGLSFLGGCAGSPYDDDPLLEPPQLVEVEKEKKS
jgi:hypothetical protein